MARGQGIIYMTDSMVRTGYLADPQSGWAVTEESMALTHSPDDCRRLAAFLSEKRFAPEHLVLCVPRTRACIRFLTLPAQDEREIQRMSGYELNALFPYKPEEFIPGHSVVERLPGGYSRVLLAVIQKQVLVWYLDFVKWAGIRPDEVWISTQALCNAASRLLPSGNACLLHIDDGFAEFLFFRGGSLFYSHAVNLSSRPPYGIRLLRETLALSGYVTEHLTLSGAIAGPGAVGFIRECERELGTAGKSEAALTVTRGILVREGSVRVNLLPPELKADKISFARRKNVLTLCVVILLNMVLGLNLVFVRQSSRREYLARLSDRIRKMDAETASLQEKLSTLTSYERYSAEGRHKLRLLSAVAEACPGDVLLRSLDISGEQRKGSLVTAGRARNADTVLRFASGLKETGLVPRADVNYISKRADSGEWVDFEIKAVY